MRSFVASIFLSRCSESCLANIFSCISSLARGFLSHPCRSTLEDQWGGNGLQQTPAVVSSIFLEFAFSLHQNHLQGLSVVGSCPQNFIKKFCSWAQECACLISYQAMLTLLAVPEPYFENHRSRSTFPNLLFCFIYLFIFTHGAF